MKALLQAAADPAYPAEIVLVISNRQDAAGLGMAAGAGIETAVIDHRAFSSRPAFDDAVDRALTRSDVELVCLAGFMRILGAEFVARWSGRLINIHPSLLPAFPGLDTHRMALTAGVRLHGCSVHFVDGGVDSGPIIGQAAVPVLAADDEASLAARVLEAEHKLYPRCLALVASGQAQLQDGVVVLNEDATDAQASLFNPANP